MTQGLVRPRKPTSEAIHDSRERRLPAFSISYAVAVTEMRRTWRQLRRQDLWVLLALTVGLLLFVSTPIAFLLARQFGLEFAAGNTSISTVITGIMLLWLVFVVFGLASGLGSENEVINQTAVLTARPPKDVVGGLLLAITVTYAPFLFIPVLAASLGFVVALNTPTPLAGFILATIFLLVTALPIGYILGLTLKGVIRRTPWLARLKPVVIVALAVVYVWVSATGQLLPLLELLGTLLSFTPLGWLGQLAFVTTPGSGASLLAAVAAVVVALLLVPLATLGVLRAAEFAWYVDAEHATDREAEIPEPTERQTPGEYLDAALARCRVSAPTRGVATVVLLRAYRRPLNIAYVAVPLIFALPTFESAFQALSVPGYAPWAALVYGAWAAGSAFPLNVLGNQSAALPAILTTGDRSRALVHGYLLAATIAFLPIIVIAALALAYLAEFSVQSTLILLAATPLAVIGGSAFAAGLGAAFPRFQSISITASRKALLPSKSAFTVFSIAGMLSAIAVGIVSDQQYRWQLSQTIATYIPFFDIARDDLIPYGQVFVVVMVVLIPVAYLFARYRLRRFRLE